MRKSRIKFTISEILRFSIIFGVIPTIGLSIGGSVFPPSALAQTAVLQASKPAAQEKEAEKKVETVKKPPEGPTDEHDRGTPRSSFKGFIVATRDGKYEKAAHYMDFRYLPPWVEKSQAPTLAHKLKIILDRKLWVDFDLVSNHPDGNLNDGLPEFRESLGRIKTEDGAVDILMQKIPREDGVYIWKVSNRTVAEIPALYDLYGYSPLEESMSQFFPDVTFLGWQLWQWFIFLVSSMLTYFAASVIMWAARRLLGKKDTLIRQRLSQLTDGPIHIILWLMMVDIIVKLLGPSASIRAFREGNTIMLAAFAIASARLIALGFEWWTERLRRKEKESAIVVLKPIRSLSIGGIYVVAGLVWLDNIGFNVGTLLAGLGVGGLAVALAAQDTLKNFIGSIMILLDKPYSVGQRIVIKGHDGIVEEIGLRSTKIRLLSGHQTTVPNEQMAGSDIENIGRRPHIRRLTNIGIPYDTPPEKIERAVDLVRGILEDHEGMDPGFPPRVYFNEFNPYSLNIIMLYWYHPPAYWDFLAFNQKVNLQIMQAFEKEDIKFAFPTQTSILAQDQDHPLEISLIDKPDR